MVRLEALRQIVVGAIMIKIKIEEKCLSYYIKKKTRKLRHGLCKRCEKHTTLNAWKVQSIQRVPQG